MRRVRYSRPHHLTKLHDELVAAIPVLAPKPRKDGALYSPFTLSGDGTNLELQVPDDADTAAITAVVTAHDPTPPPPPPDPDAELAKQIGAATTLDELKAALLGKSGVLAAGTEDPQARVKGRPK